MSDYKIIEFNGTKYNVQLELENFKEYDLDNCLKTLNTDELFNYLYNYHNNFFNEINEDPYFEGKKIESGKDLKNSIESIEIITIKDDVIYICGEYWCDPEHGFSIAFPKGNFIKSQYNFFEYNRDVGLDVDYIPCCTVLGESSDGF